MKPFTYAIALDTGVFPRNTTFRAGTFTYTFDPNTNKITRVANGTETAYPPISDALEEDFGVITFEQGLAFSSNVGICELLSNYVNYNQYVDYMDKFGFFKYVDSPYVSESLGVNNIANLPQDYLSSDLVNQVQLLFCNYCKLILQYSMVERWLNHMLWIQL